MIQRTATLSALLLVALGALGVIQGWLHTVLAPVHRATALLFAVDPPEKTVSFVVLDTVRADHLSACGSSRPTTPVLQDLVAKDGALSCEARAPGSWTLPSHASFFTGLTPLEHRADFVSGS